MQIVNGQRYQRCFYHLVYVHTECLNSHATNWLKLTLPYLRNLTSAARRLSEKRTNFAATAIGPLSVIIHIIYPCNKTKLGDLRWPLNATSKHYFNIKHSRGHQMSHSQGWRIFLLLLLTTASSTCLQHSHILGPAQARIPAHY